MTAAGGKGGPGEQPPKNANLAQRIAFAFETVTSQLPDQKEQAMLSDLLKSLKSTYNSQPSLADELCEGDESRRFPVPNDKE